ncbi:hypothetical protein K437DRAFT_256829 [Tilletiaria anomala UBC 951]|uniref:Inositol-pentakisphosphate 2-kinase n=1 Tax=Tilletiaria anomala (strain ATCC 24038 / CBS 436.72 / UBC 951) TaxID=1037660 RepID=A0A066VTV6_TILAU|nr:uncharacterized protein K437DRAFT_256829 [Tilletiaria anomala UBC 951]KDN44876.1 hypothetical protein K437DRAFT_256829 [Tilletiaria anomala UBC 951]
MSGWPPTNLDASLLHAEEWSFLAEGGQNLLLRYTGPIASSPQQLSSSVGSPFLGEEGALALRVKKQKLKSGKNGKPQTPQIDSQAFQSKVIVPLLGLSDVLPASIPIELPCYETADIHAQGHPFVEAIARRIEESRPERRRLIDEIDPSASLIWAVEDLTSSGHAVTASRAVPRRVLAVEIKPKWLFLPALVEATDREVKATFDFKKNISRYKMHRIHRDPSLSLAEWQQLYDPLDLASRDPARTRHALEALWNEWRRTSDAIPTAGNESDDINGMDNGDAVASSASTQQHMNNNLRVYLNGNFLCGEQWAELTEFLSVELSEDHVKQAFLDLLLSHLHASPLLERLAVCQSAADIQLLGQGWSDLERSEPVSDVGASSAAPFQLKDGSSSAAATIMKEPTLQELIEAVMIAPGAQSNRAARLLAKSHRAEILQYVVSATFKDCSMFLRFIRNSEHDGPECSIRLIDLDPKPVGSMYKWWKIDQEIVESFKAWVEKNRLDWDKSTTPWKLVQKT